MVAAVLTPGWLCHGVSDRQLGGEESTPITYLSTKCVPAQKLHSLGVPHPAQARLVGPWEGEMAFLPPAKALWGPVAGERGDLEASEGLHFPFEDPHARGNLTLSSK